MNAMFWHNNETITFECDAIDGIDYESFINEPCIKFHFFDIDEKEMKNVNKRSRRTNKHVELWARNAFDNWKLIVNFTNWK